MEQLQHQQIRRRREDDDLVPEEKNTSAPSYSHDDSQSPPPPRSLNAPAAQLKEAGSLGAGPVAPPAVQVQQQLQGKGQSLSGDVRSGMENAMGTDLSGVKVHTGAQGNEIAQQHNARAVTVGQDIAFASGEFQPGTMTGDALLAHELHHTQQQKGATAAQAKHENANGNENDFEKDADEAALSATGKIHAQSEEWESGMEGKSKSAKKTGLRLQRCGGGSGSAPNKKTATDSLKTVADTLKTQKSPADKPDDQLSYADWKAKYSKKMEGIRDVVGDQVFAADVQVRQDRLTGAKNQVTSAASVIKKKAVAYKNQIQFWKDHNITPPGKTSLTELLSDPGSLSDTDLTKLATSLENDKKLLTDNIYQPMTKKGGTIDELLQAINQLKSNRASVKNLETALTDATLKQEHKKEANKYNEGYLAEGVKIILDRVASNYSVIMTPLDLRAISGYEQRDKPNPTAKSSAGAIGIGQITDNGLSGGSKWINNQAWTDDQKKQMVFFDPANKLKAVTLANLKPLREDTSKAQQLMASAVAATINQLSLNGVFNHGKLTNLEKKMLVIGAYNAGAGGLSGHVDSKNYKWQDISTGFTAETRKYVGGVLARLPISELQGAKFLDLSYAFSEITNKNKNQGTIGASLVTLPVEYTKLTSLEKLDLTGNKFTSLPAQMKNLVNLKELILKDNLVDDTTITNLQKAIPGLKVTK